MSSKRRRARTGCLTCRARRIKCDEKVPGCDRCLIANIACAGYEPQRIIVSVKSSSRAQRQQRESDQHIVHTQQVQKQLQEDDSGNSSNKNVQPQSRVQHAATGDSDSLIAFPSSPRSDQCPGLGARHVLGYQQVFMHTIPKLFPAQHLKFWRDELSQAAWGCNCLYLTLVALGNGHRAALLASSNGEKDRANGLDIKITAVQLYTQALEDLSMNIDKVKRDPIILIASLCLMAYFESLNGNIPAFIGRVQSAQHYFVRSFEHGHEQSRDLTPLQHCIRSLSQTCHVAVPLAGVHATPNEDSNGLGKARARDISSNGLVALAELVDMTYQNRDMHELVWTPIAAYSRGATAANIKSFRQKLAIWKDEYRSLIPELDTDRALDVLLTYKWSQFAIPPIPYASTTLEHALIAAHFNFYQARLHWALNLLGEDEEQHQTKAEFYFYEALRHVVTCMTTSTTSDGRAEHVYIPCEALKNGILPILHIVGLCSPEPRWLHWIKDTCDEIPQEGVLKGHTFATNLHCLHQFEIHRSGSIIPVVPERYPVPADRIICQLIPEMDGRHFTSYFARPVPGINAQSKGVEAYRVIGHARWRCGYEELPCTPVLEMYDHEGADLDAFSLQWLYNTPPAQEWLAWSREKEFRMDRALQDHISGTRLLLAVESTQDVEGRLEPMMT